MTFSQRTVFEAAPTSRNLNVPAWSWLGTEICNWPAFALKTAMTWSFPFKIFQQILFIAGLISTPIIAPAVTVEPQLTSNGTFLSGASPR
jgi:hypothetical protein